MEVAAHRGNVEGFPENTMPAFESAYSLGVDMIELDLRMTKDGEIVVIHDPSVDRTSDGHGLVSDMTLAELKELDFGIKTGEKFRGTRIPTFREFLELTRRDDKMQFNFELKDYIHDKGEKFALESASKAIALFEEYGLADRLYINSFEGDLLLWIDKTYPFKRPVGERAGNTALNKVYGKKVPCEGPSFKAVSYTHLDVYKRQT